MKKSELRQIIREEIQKLNEMPFRGVKVNNKNFPFIYGLMGKYVKKHGFMKLSLQDVEIIKPSENTIAIEFVTYRPGGNLADKYRFVYDEVNGSLTLEIYGSDEKFPHKVKYPQSKLPKDFELTPTGETADDI